MPWSSEHLEAIVGYVISDDVILTWVRQFANWNNKYFYCMFYTRAYVSRYNGKKRKHATTRLSQLCGPRRRDSVRICAVATQSPLPITIKTLFWKQEAIVLTLERAAEARRCRRLPLAIVVRRHNSEKALICVTSRILAISCVVRTMTVWPFFRILLHKTGKINRQYPPIVSF